METMILALFRSFNYLFQPLTLPQLITNVPKVVERVLDVLHRVHERALEHEALEAGVEMGEAA